MERRDLFYFVVVVVVILTSCPEIKIGVECICVRVTYLNVCVDVCTF